MANLVSLLLCISIVSTCLLLSPSSSAQKTTTTSTTAPSKVTTLIISDDTASNTTATPKNDTSTKKPAAKTGKPAAAAAGKKPTASRNATTTTAAPSTSTTDDLDEDDDGMSTTMSSNKKKGSSKKADRKKSNKKQDENLEELEEEEENEDSQTKKSNKTATTTSNPLPPAVPLDMFSEFYHINAEKSKTLPQADDTAAKLTDIYVPVTLYDRPYQDVYVDNNGIITLGSNTLQYQALQFPLPYAAIAPLYQDVDTRGEGFVRYQVVNKREQLALQQRSAQIAEQQRQQGLSISAPDENPAEDPIARASETVQHFYPRSGQSFEPDQVIIAQWEEVGYYNARTDKLNTYQAVIASDNLDSYVIFLYGQLEWDAADSKQGQPRMPAQAGFIGDRSYAYIIKEYGKPLEKLLRGTNVGKPGMYVFHIGRVAQNGGQIRGPEIATNSPDENFTAYPSESRYGPSSYGGSNDGAREQQLQGQRQRQQQNGQNGSAGGYPSYDEYYGEQVDEYERRQQQEQRQQADRVRQQPQQQTDPYEQQRREYYAQQERDRAAREQQPPPPQQPGIYPVVGGVQQQQVDQYGRPIPSYYNNNNNNNADGDDDYGSRFSYNGRAVVDRPSAESRQLYDARHGHDYSGQQQQQRHQGPNDGTCSTQDKSKCDAKAGICTGGCCRCQDGMLGNGVVCIRPNEALRMHGTVSGTLDGEPINAATIFTHALLEEGRVYGAFGDVDPNIGPRLIAILPTVATLGWLAAIPNGAQKQTAAPGGPPNGIDIAGLEFVSNMQLKFGTGETCTIRTTFIGHEQGRDLVARVNVEIDGELPDAPKRAEDNNSTQQQLSSQDLRVTYLKTAPGTYKAEWSMQLSDDALEQHEWLNVSVTETITYRECPQLPEEDAPTEVHIQLERPYGLWQNESRAARYSVGARVYDERYEQQQTLRAQHHQRNGGQQHEDGYQPHYREGFYGHGTGGAGEHQQQQQNGEEQPPYGAAGGYDPYYDAAQRERERQRQEQQQQQQQGGNGDFSHREHVGGSSGGTAVVIVPNESATDPCQRLPMPEQAVCTVQDGHARYDCVQGLRVAEWLPYGDSAYKPRCEDVDECVYGQDNCAEEADCINTMGSFRCQCKSGYMGDGVTCTSGNGAGSPPIVTGDDRLTAHQQPGIYPVPYQPQPSVVVAECARLQCAAEATCVMNPEYSKPECRCNPGYRGDGYVCTPDNPQAVNCMENRGVCDSNAECQADGRCVCRAGFAGDGTICIDADEQCNIQNNCHPNARCMHNAQDGSYLCKCVPGYIGNGYQCQAESQVGAVDPKDCSRYTTICDANAQCILDRNEKAYRCRCYPGYAGNGIQCNRAAIGDEQNCYANPNLCHSNAACRPSSSSASSAACKCREGYVGDGINTCAPAPRGGFIVFTQGQAVMRKYVDANTVEPGDEIVALRGQTAVGIAADCRQGYVYWSDIRTNTIQRISYKDKSNKGTVFDKEIGSPEGMVIDPVSRNIFWTDSQRDHVVVANIDHPEAGAKVIVTGNLTNPRGIAILPQRGYVFWTDWNRQEPKIERADMDGNNRRVLFDKNAAIGLQLPNAIAVCPVTERIYWADAGTHKIMSSDLDGQDAQIVNDNARYPFSMALLDNTLYWSDWEKNKIMFASKTTGEQAKELDRPLTASGRVYGIAAVPDTCPTTLNSRCADASTLCRFMCLPLPQGRDECVCPDGIDPAECQQASVPYYQRR